MNFEDNIDVARPFTRQDMEEVMESVLSAPLHSPTMIIHPYDGFSLLWCGDNWRGKNGTRWRDLVAAFTSWAGAKEETVQGYIAEIKAERSKRQKRVKAQLRRSKKGY